MWNSGIPILSLNALIHSLILMPYIKHIVYFFHHYVKNQLKYLINKYLQIKDDPYLT